MLCVELRHLGGRKRWEAKESGSCEQERGGGRGRLEILDAQQWPPALQGFAQGKALPR